MKTDHHHLQHLHLEDLISLFHTQSLLLGLALADMVNEEATVFLLMLTEDREHN